MYLHTVSTAFAYPHHTPSIARSDQRMVLVSCDSWKRLEHLPGAGCQITGGPLMRYIVTPLHAGHSPDSGPCHVPLSPQALAHLYARYLALIKARRLPKDTTFGEFYRVWRSGRRGENEVGLDDGAIRSGPSTDKQPITRPDQQLHGVVRTIVLLADFP